MRILPVIDLKGGVVVRGIAGRREDYRPINSALVNSCHPLEVANAFRNHFGFHELYLADLDAIAGAEPAWTIYAELHRAGFPLWLDAGIRDSGLAQRFKDAGVHRLIAGLETTPGLRALAELVAAVGTSTLVFSLDLKHGEPMGDSGAWKFAAPLEIVAAVVALGVQRFIVLDVGRVGVNQGPGTFDLCRAVRAHHPNLELIAGGGVRGKVDMQAFLDAGVDAVLVASALHDGIITREHWTAFAH